jgi:pyruvate,water dikinase
MAIQGARRNHRHVGICGEAPANYPEIAGFVARLGIDSISVNPDSVLRTMAVVSGAEREAGILDLDHDGARSPALTYWT